MDVGTAIAQGRDVNRENIQAVEEVRAKAARLHGLLEVAVSGGDDANIYSNRATAAYRLKFAFLKDAQQLNLCLQRELTDFVQEDGAAIGQFEPAGPPLQSARERTLHVAEEFALDQACRDRAA